MPTNLFLGLLPCLKERPLKHRLVRWFARRAEACQDRKVADDFLNQNFAVVHLSDTQWLPPVPIGRYWLKWTDFAATHDSVEH